MNDGCRIFGSAFILAVLYLGEVDCQYRDPGIGSPATGEIIQVNFHASI